MNRLRFVLALLMLPLALACSDSTDPLKAEEFAGLYMLKSINGHVLPTTLEMEGGAVSITSGDIELIDDLTWSVALNGTSAEDTPVEQLSNGTLTIDGRKIRLTDSDSHSSTKLTATLNGRILTVKFDDEDFVFVFERMEAA